MIRSCRNVDIVGLLDCAGRDWGFCSILNPNFTFLRNILSYQPPCLTSHSLLFFTFSEIMIAIHWGTVLPSCYTP